MLIYPPHYDVTTPFYYTVTIPCHYPLYRHYSCHNPLYYDVTNLALYFYYDIYCNITTPLL